MIFVSGFASSVSGGNKRGGLVRNPQQSTMGRRCLHLFSRRLLLLASLLLLGSIPSSSYSLPLQSTTVHRVDAAGRVKSHGGFLGGYPFKVSGLTRSFAPPDFILRPGGNLREAGSADSNKGDLIPDVETSTVLGNFPYNLAN